MCLITLCTLCGIPCITSICGVTTLGFAGLGALGLGIIIVFAILAFIISTILVSGVCAVGGLLSLLYTILAVIGSCWLVWRNWSSDLAPSNIRRVS